MKRISIFFLSLIMIFGLFPQVSAQESDKMNFLFLGTDSGYLPDRPAEISPSRSDAIVIVTLDKKNKQVTVSSMPRDTLLEIPGYGGEKATHAFAYGGVDLTKQSLEAMLDIKFDKYVVANMGGFVNIIDLLKGITVIPPMSFSHAGFTFVEGQSQHIDGAQALSYARERYTSGGDYARQMRMREMVAVILKMAIDSGDIEAYRPLFEQRGELVDTDFTFDEVVELYEEYGNDDLVFKDFGLLGSSYNDPAAGYVEIPDPDSFEEFLSILQ